MIFVTIFTYLLLVRYQVDYFTGKQYRGGQILNNFDAPLWKLPVFVKNGSIIPMYAENNNPEAKTETNKEDARLIVHSVL